MLTQRRALSPTCKGVQVLEIIKFLLSTIQNKLVKSMFVPRAQVVWMTLVSWWGNQQLSKLISLWQGNQPVNFLPLVCVYSRLIYISTQKSGDLSLLLGLFQPLYAILLSYPISIGCCTRFWWTISLRLGFYRESEHFCVVLGSPHLVWSPSFTIFRLHICILLHFFWFFGVNTFL